MSIMVCKLSRARTFVEAPFKQIGYKALALECAFQYVHNHWPLRFHLIMKSEVRNLYNNLHDTVSHKPIFR